MFLVVSRDHVMRQLMTKHNEPIRVACLRMVFIRGIVQRVEESYVELKRLVGIEGDYSASGIVKNGNSVQLEIKYIA